MQNMKLNMNILLLGVVVSLSSTFTQGFLFPSSIRTSTSSTDITSTGNTISSTSSTTSSKRIQLGFQTVKEAKLLPTTLLFLQPSENDGEAKYIESTSDVADLSNLSLSEITAEAKQAMKDAEAALQASSKINLEDDINNQLENEINNAREAQRRANELARLAQQKQETTARQIEAFVSSIGAFSFGLVSGGVLDIFIVMNGLDMDIDLVVPPAALAFTFAVAAFVVGQNDDETGKLVRNVFAGPLKQVTNSLKAAITSKIEQTVDDIKATPGKIQSAIEQKVQETTEEIKAIPVKVKDNIEAQVEKTVDDIKAIPVKAKVAATEAVEKAKEEITDATVRTVEEIKATPGRVAKETKEAIVKTVEDVEDKIEKSVTGAVDEIKKTVDEVASLPTKTMNKVSLMHSHFFSRIVTNTYGARADSHVQLSHLPHVSYTFHFSHLDFRFRFKCKTTRQSSKTT